MWRFDFFLYGLLESRYDNGIIYSGVCWICGIKVYVVVRRLLKNSAEFFVISLTVIRLILFNFYSFEFIPYVYIHTK